MTSVGFATLDPDKGRELFGTVWKYNGTEFVKIDAADFSVAAAAAIVGENQEISHHVPSITIDNIARGPMSDEVRMQAYARKSGIVLRSFPENDVGLTDWLPDEAGAGAVTIRPVAPQFPLCFVTPLELGPGQTATVEISGMPANEPVHVVLGDQDVAAGSTNEQGEAKIDFTIPFDADSGDRLVTVGVDGTALTADCFVTVMGPAQVAIDVKPGSCPNPLNTKSRGVIPVAIPGDVDFDVTSIDPTSLRLLGVPSRSRVTYEDVTSPYKPAGDVVDCLDCRPTEPDGILDLVTHFPTQQVVEALGDLEDRQCIRGILTASLSDGTPIAGEDRIWILKRRSGDLNPLETLEEEGRLWAVYPNPLRQGQGAKLSYTVPQGGARVQIGMYDVAGRLVRELVNQTEAAGVRHLDWNGHDTQGRVIRPGVYFVKMRVGLEQRHTQLLILR